jgi:uncharacterized OB-fold protein
MHHAIVPGFEAAVPYVVAVVELVEQSGLRILTNIVDTGIDVAVGDEVHVVFDKRANHVAPQFAPVQTRDGAR